MQRSLHEILVVYANPFPFSTKYGTMIKIIFEEFYMSELEYLLAYAKQCHEAKDAADILDIAQDIQQLDFFYQKKTKETVAEELMKHS